MIFLFKGEQLKNQLSSTDKISDSWIRNLEFNSHLHQKIDWCLSLIIKSYHQKQTSQVETLLKKIN